MRQVRECDFCAEDATGVYEPYPPSVPDSPRLLLCEDCHDRLASVVEPLVDALDDPEALAAGADRRADETTADDRSGDAGVDADASSAPEDGAPDAVATAATGDESVEAGGRPVSDRGGTPPNYRKVMRFLENREMPIDRAEAERMAAEAYDLGDSAVAEVVDHAVEYGRLREVGGELKR